MKLTKGAAQNLITSDGFQTLITEERQSALEAMAYAKTPEDILQHQVTVHVIDNLTSELERIAQEPDEDADP